MRMTLPGLFLSCVAGETGQMGSELESTNTQNVLTLIVAIPKSTPRGFDPFHSFVTWWDGYYWLQVFVWANFVFEYLISPVIYASYIVSSESELSFGQVILFHKWTSVACQKSGFHLCCTNTHSCQGIESLKKRPKTERRNTHFCHNAVLVSSNLPALNKVFPFQWTLHWLFCWGNPN